LDTLRSSATDRVVANSPMRLMSRIDTKMVRRQKKRAKPVKTSPLILRCACSNQLFAAKRSRGKRDKTGKTCRPAVDICVAILIDATAPAAVNGLAPRFS
jgi:hypothetical protein